MSNELFAIIRRSLPKNISLNEAIADALEISYDAAHRRTTGKSKLSLVEGLKLAAHYGLSLDALKEQDANDLVTVQKTTIIKTVTDIEDYFRQSAASIAALITMEEVKVFYSAKDIPIFYLLDGNTITRFKIFVWLRLLSTDYENVSFENFNLPLSTLQAAKELGQLYQPIPKTEIWDTTTFNSMLKQIHFYFEAGLLEANSAIRLCEELSGLLRKIHAVAGASNKDYQLFHNELLLMNNTVLITSKHQKAFYVPFTFLSYFLATDPVTCNQASNYIEKQVKRSRSLNTAGERAQNVFFDKIAKRIEALRLLVTARNVLDFE